MTDDYDEEQQIQEQQYEYPYHYLPRIEGGQFTQTQYWSWGMHYLGGMRVVLDQLQEWSFESLVDIGCGDGRFLRELNESHPEVTSLGVDYSERSIAMANGMNPHLQYEARNILEEDLDREYDVATCIEVLEHIPPEECELFVEAITETLTNDGKLVLTVPHANKPVADKHYQHFDSALLSELLEPPLRSRRIRAVRPPVEAVYRTRTRCRRPGEPSHRELTSRTEPTVETLRASICVCTN